MRFELKNLVKSLRVTTLYVTHDQMEALTMSDKVAVMQGGVFVEEAPKTVLAPALDATATFLGETNLIAGKVVGRAASDGLWLVETAHGPIVCPMGDGPAGQDSVWVACRPEGAVVTAVRLPGENVFPGRITRWCSLGIRSCSIAVGEQAIQVKVIPFAAFKMAIKFLCSYLPRGVY